VPEFRLPAFRPQPATSGNLPVAAFRSETQAALQRLTPHRSFNVLYWVTGMIVLSFVLMSVVKIDRVVTGTGEVIPVEGSLFVQPLDRAIIKDIKVRVGDVVRKGQVLGTLDPTFAEANLNQFESRGVANYAMVARLEAEANGTEFVPAKTDPDYDLQLAVFRQRRTEYRQSLADFDARLAALQSAVVRENANAGVYTRQLEIAERVRGMRENLEQKGYGSKLNTIIATANKTDVERQLGESRNQAIQGGNELQALRAQRAVFISKWHDDVSTQLATARRQLNDDQQETNKARKVSQLINLVAPEDAVVLDIGTASAGSVVEPNPGTKPLFTLTPIKGRLEAEVAVGSRDIGFVQPGDKVTIKIDAYDFLRHGTATGKIVSVSEGSFNQDSAGNKREPFFKIRVRLDELKLHNVPKNFRLIPGMTLSGDVMVGGARSCPISPAAPSGFRPKRCESLSEWGSLLFFAVRARKPRMQPSCIVRKSTSSAKGRNKAMHKRCWRWRTRSRTEGPSSRTSPRPSIGMSAPPVKAPFRPAPCSVRYSSWGAARPRPANVPPPASRAFCAHYPYQPTMPKRPIGIAWRPKPATWRPRPALPHNMPMASASTGIVGKRTGCSSSLPSRGTPLHSAASACSLPVTNWEIRTMHRQPPGCGRPRTKATSPQAPHSPS
jgi:HlyD family type I secretion membrane fusion protein